MGGLPCCQQPMWCRCLWVKVWQAEITRSGCMEAVEVWKVWKGLSHDSCEVVYIPSVIFWIFQMWIACALSSQYSPYKLHIQHDVLVIMAVRPPQKEPACNDTGTPWWWKKWRSSIFPKIFDQWEIFSENFNPFPWPSCLKSDHQSSHPSRVSQVVLRGMDLILWPASVSGIPSFPMVFGWWWD